MDILIVLVVISIAAGAVAQAVTGMGFSLVSAPALLALLGPREGVAVVVLLAAMSSVFPLSQQWRSVRLGSASALLLPILFSTPVIAMALAGADTRLVAVAAGVGVVAGVVLLARGASWAWFRGLPGALAAGIASATLNVVGGVGGPPIGMYAANTDWGPVQTRATLQFVFLVQNLVTAVVIGLVAPAWWMVATLIAATMVGALLMTRVPAKAARLAVLAVAGLGGASLVLANV
jgi:uncharacterized membrane protein YfcA